jgi:hypothetical protein
MTDDNELFERAKIAMTGLSLVESEQMKRYVDFIVSERRNIWDFEKKCHRSHIGSHDLQEINEKISTVRTFAENSIQGILSCDDDARFWMFAEGSFLVPPEDISEEAKSLAYLMMEHSFGY